MDSHARRRKRVFVVGMIERRNLLKRCFSAGSRSEARILGYVRVRLKHCPPFSAPTSRCAARSAISPVEISSRRAPFFLPALDVFLNGLSAIALQAPHGDTQLPGQGAVRTVYLSIPGQPHLSFSCRTTSGIDDLLPFTQWPICHAATHRAVYVSPLALCFDHRRDSVRAPQVLRLIAPERLPRLLLTTKAFCREHHRDHYQFLRVVWREASRGSRVPFDTAVD